MVKLALMVAIIFVMAFSPLGYLRTPGLTITFLTVPVAVGAIILGPTAGAICGAAFGLTSVAMALTGGSAFSAALLQINPFGLLFTCLVPRILEGWICGLIFQLVKKFSKNGAFIVASLSCPLLNTLFFMSSLVLFFYNTEYIQGIVTKLGATNPLIFVILFVGVQGAIEAVACTIWAAPYPAHWLQHSVSKNGLYIIEETRFHKPQDPCGLTISNMEGSS